MNEKPHRKLNLWQKSIEYVIQIYKTSKQFPDKERFGIISQMQRAAISIPCNIAEGAARKSRKEFVQFLYTARGSVSELDTQLEICLQLHYITPEHYKELQNRLDEISKILNGLISSIK